jgi:hypothetical protein
MVQSLGGLRVIIYLHHTLRHFVLVEIYPLLEEVKKREDFYFLVRPVRPRRGKEGKEGKEGKNPEV